METRQTPRWRICAAALTVVSSLSASAGHSAGNSPTGSRTPSSSAAAPAQQQSVEQRVQALEQENAQLRQDVSSLKAATQPASATAQAPGETPLSVTSQSTQVTPPEFDTLKYVSTGDFPGSINIPGTNISIAIGGFAQVDAITDTNNIGSTDSFIVSSIPTSGETAGQTSFSARQTRLFVRTEAPTDWGPLITYVEGDFFGPDGTDFRLRHAYGQVGKEFVFLGGQTYSTFMDASVYPAIFDYQGPNGMVLVRQPMLRFTHNFRDDAKYSIALEDPNPDFTISPSQTGNETAVFPDLAGNLRWTKKWGHLQGAAIARQLTFDPPVGERSNAVGWGVNFSGQVYVFEPVAEGKQDSIVFQIAGGEGIGTYFNDTNGLAMDGFVDSTGDLSAHAIIGGFVAYQHYWTPKFASSAGYSYLRVDSPTEQGGGTYEQGHYGVVNIMFYPVDRIWTGFEVLYGVREDQDGSSGNDGRLSFSVQYRF